MTVYIDEMKAVLDLQAAAYKVKSDVQSVYGGDEVPEMETVIRQLQKLLRRLERCGRD